MIRSDENDVISSGPCGFLSSAEHGMCTHHGTSNTYGGVKTQDACMEYSVHRLGIINDVMKRWAGMTSQTRKDMHPRHAHVYTTGGWLPIGHETLQHELLGGGLTGENWSAAIGLNTLCAEYPMVLERTVVSGN